MRMQQGFSWRIYVGLLGSSLVLAACSSNPPAPVIDRLPSHTNQTSQPQSTPSAKTISLANRPTYKSGDWRPDNYVVKKGDTLFSIGLEFGYDYKEIASANKIAAPYVIKVGQSLALGSLKEPDDSTNGANSAVTTYPLNGAPNTATVIVPTVVAPSAAVTPQKSAIPTLSEPKAIREPYSDIALKAPLPTAKPANAVTVKPVEIAIAKTPTTPDKSVETKPTETKAVAAGDMNWAWPTAGKVVSTFNQAGNKGIDIAGARGQSIMAAAPGKVIYSGSDLRGYGKLVIIKHSANYLSVYAHNNVIIAKEGQQVSRGQKIAEMGSTDSNTVKLHFEIRNQGKSVDPMQYLSN